MSRNHDFNAMQKNSNDGFGTKEAQADKSSFSGDGFSDIDLDDIADEDFTKGVEKVGTGLLQDNLKSAVTGPSTAGKYTTNNSKRIAASLEMMNKTTTNKMKHSSQVNMQTESHVVKETMQ